MLFLFNASSSNKSPFARFLSALAGLVAFGVIFIFALPVFIFLALVLVCVWLYFLWKIKKQKQIFADMAKQMRDAVHAENSGNSEEARFDAFNARNAAENASSFEGAIIEGEATRIDENAPNAKT